MKKFFVSLLLVTTSVLGLSAQDKRMSTNIGLGVALPMNDYKDLNETGYHFNAGFSYLINENFGLAATAYGMSSRTKLAKGLVDYTGEDKFFTIAGLMVGPMFTYPIVYKKFDVEARILAGVSGSKLPQVYEDLADTKSEFYTFSYGGGAGLKWHYSDLLAFSVNYDLYLMHPDLGGEMDKVNLNASAISANIAVKF